MTHWEAALLGIIQGLTEFLPVSSSGHLELGKSLFGLSDIDLTFSVLVHGATACSTLVVFRKDIIQLIVGLVRTTSENAAPSRRYVGWLLASAVPAALVAFTLRDALESTFINQPQRVGYMLCVTAVILLFSERIRSTTRPLNLPRAAAIGLAQAMAIIPGISRSGSTIGMAIAIGISREEAARFSFLMALPVILGATALEILDLVQEPSIGEASVAWSAYLIGAVAAFVSGWGACYWMIRWVKNTSLNAFAIYCLIAGLTAIAIL